MPPPRRGARRRTAAAASTKSPHATRASRRLSVQHGEPFKRDSRGSAAAATAGDDDGMPLSDEILLLVFSALSATIGDLVRCAATCRRWRRLVSADAAFICRHAPPCSDPFVRTLALGFFDSRTNGVAPTRFVSLPSAGSRLQPSFAALVDGASRVVASRNGHLVLDLRRRANSRITHTVRLGVCNPVTADGSVDVLPLLRGKESPTGPYACTVITAADEYGSDRHAPRSQHASYRVLLLYNRRSFTALRCYSSSAGSWGPEAVVTGARIGRNQLAGELHAVVVRYGVVFWPRLAMSVRLDSLLQPAPVASVANNNGNAQSRHTVAGFSLAVGQRLISSQRRLLGVTPDGRMLRVDADSETIRVYCGGDADGDGDDISCARLTGESLEWKWTMKQGLMRVHTVRLRWLCEKSGLVIFTARNGHDPDTHVYTIDIEKKQFRRVATCSEPASLGEMCGYEMDRVTLLASLGR
ncbi:hypothetical protein BAE44_0020765 [Dichanthelium oligosanthes]|uniref:F-box domain-containing protein n=1 Tax=Dichanthelium oligosanthes TaxID=888268 RepID=A0A1E5UZ91_9POAL|nr:hypothetical protein BAE44_0020765 [Dichanthelium oligosanthes]